MYYVYVLLSEKTGTRYIGSTDNIQRRLNEHNKGRSPYTSRLVPWRLLYSEKFETRGQAAKRERSLKTGKGREELDRILKNYSGIV